MIRTGRLLDVGEFLYHSDTYVETGTAAGDSVDRALRAGYKRIKSVEFFRPLFEFCVEKFKGKNVELYFGKSTDELHRMLADVYKPAVILLDAHPAGPNTAGHDDLMEKGGESAFTQHRILLEEIAVILEHRNDHIVIIDDQSNPDDYNEYVDMFKKANPNYTFYFYDEQLNETAIFYKDKCLVAIPS